MIEKLINNFDKLKIKYIDKIIKIQKWIDNINTKYK